MVIFVLCKNQSNNNNKTPKKQTNPKQTKNKLKTKQKHHQPLQAKKINPNSNSAPPLPKKTRPNQTKQNTTTKNQQTTNTYPLNYTSEISFLRCNMDQDLSPCHLFHSLIFRSFNKGGEQRVEMIQRNGNRIQSTFTYRSLDQVQPR